MTATAIALAVLAILLAWPIPMILSRARWTARAPGTALILWQSVALAGGLSMIGSLLSYGLEPYGANFVTALWAFGQYLTLASLPTGAHFGHLFALSSAILLVFHLVLNLALTFVRAERSRRRHRMLVGLLTEPDADHRDTRILEQAAPLAYCLPGAAGSLTVLSSGLIDLLDEDQLRAVIAHESAHAFQRHHLVLLAFRAWRGSLPWFPIATEAHHAVAVLVEMLADDQARREVSDDVLAASIALVASHSAVRDATGEFSPPREFVSDSPAAVARVVRLSTAVVPLAARWRVTAALGAVTLLAIPTILILAPTFA